MRTLFIAAFVGIYGAIVVDAFFVRPHAPLTHLAEASQLEVIPIEASATSTEATSTEADTPKVVKLEVITNWTKDRIEAEIRATFPEEPNTAVAIATEEGGLLKERQSDYRKNGVRERSFCTFQVHEPSWHTEAVRLGYGEYKTNPKHCILMARHIYEAAGNNWSDWSAYTNGSYKKHL